MFSSNLITALLENKTTSFDLDDPFYWQRLSIDNQISLYWDALKSIGYAPDTILYNVVRKSDKRPATVPLLDSKNLKQVVDIVTGQRIENKNGSWKQSVNNKESQKLLTRPETPQEYGQRVFREG